MGGGRNERTPCSGWGETGQGVRIYYIRYKRSNLYSIQMLQLTQFLIQHEDVGQKKFHLAITELTPHRF